MKTKLFLVLSALACVAFALPAMADDAQPENHHKHHHHHHHHGHWHHHAKKAFRFGVCVGQGLAQQGVLLPAPKPGEKPKFDDATKAAFKAAVKACKAAFKADNSEQADLADEANQPEASDAAPSLD